VTTEDGKEVRLVEPKANPKVQAVLDIMEEMPSDGKAIVFTMFRETVSILVNALHSYNPVTLVGGQDDIEEAKAQFESDPDCRVIVVQQQAGKYGHTLLGGGTCATTIFAENSWSLDTRLQALARNHRHGQRNVVVAHDLTASPIDRAVLEAQRAKLTNASQLVDRFKAMKKEAFKI
jgi:ERCC4-related helicase